MDDILIELANVRKSTLEMSSSFSESDSSSALSSSDEDEEQFICRLCNKEATGQTGKDYMKELCKACHNDFPERMFCRSCKRYFPNRESFEKSKDRCNFCCKKLEKMREARKKSNSSGKQRVDTKEKPEVEEKKKKKAKTSDIRSFGESKPSTSKVTEKGSYEPNIIDKTWENIDGNYMALFIKGKCVVKKEFKL